MDLMRESPFAQYLTQQAREEGIEQGERKHAIEAWILCRRSCLPSCTLSLRIGSLKSDELSRL